MRGVADRQNVDREPLLVAVAFAPMTTAERLLLASLERDTFDDVHVTPTARRYLAMFDGWPREPSDSRERARRVTYRQWREADYRKHKKRRQRERQRARRRVLTPTESQVLALYADGHSVPEIADRLDRGSETVKTHLAAVRDKTGCRNACLLARLAVRLGLVSP